MNKKPPGDPVGSLAPMNFCCRYRFSEKNGAISRAASIKSSERRPLVQNSLDGNSVPYRRGGDDVISRQGRQAARKIHEG